MPEDPSILILKEFAQKFIGKEILAAQGNAKIEMDQLPGLIFEEYRIFGKQSYLVMQNLVIRIHLLMFGSYSIDEQTKPDRQLRLHLKFHNGDLVLFRIGVHPESLIGKLPPKKLSALIFEARNYSFDFLRWKKDYVLKKNWLVHTKKTCPKCGNPIIKKHTGLTNRRSFFCEKDQKLYS